MIATLATKLFHTIEKLFSQSASKGSMTHIQYELLHNIAFTVVLVKAYNILMEYAKHKHISIKYIIEIAIIAPVVEIIFNYNSYDFKMLIFLGVLAVFMSGLYLIFYDKLKLAEEDHDNDHK
ncbi:hypothetical protein KGV55_00940 [Candidatus Gracilibacteria bacterium]|nr:hypothetical protein [Candidatus Gracilibacteria bacterium]